jgi:hypothetical protein
VEGSRVAFVVDVSQSMSGPRRARADRELIAALRGLPPEATFSVTFFDERIRRFRDRPLPARPQEKLDLERALAEVESKSFTDLFGAIEDGLGLLGAGSRARDPAPGLDDLFLLTDGLPNRGRLRGEDGICEGVAALNAGRARIHTVALGVPESPLLRRLAAENGGRHVVTAP